MSRLMASPSRRTSCPATVASPLLGASSPVSIRIAVVFPAPLAPRKPNTSPAPTSNEMWSTAVKAPKVRVRSRARIARSATCASLFFAFGRTHAGDERVFDRRIGLRHVGIVDAVLAEIGRGLVRDLLRRDAVARVGEMQRLAERVNRLGVGILTKRAKSPVAVRGANSKEWPIERRRDRLWRIDREQLTALDQRDAIAAIRLVHVRGGDDDREPRCFEVAEQIPEFAARHCIDTCGGFVEKQKWGAVDERAAERELLFHPTRQRRRAPRLERLELTVNGGDLLVLPLDRRPEDRREEAEILLDAKVRIEREPTGHVADLTPQRPQTFHDVAAQNARRTAVGKQKRGENPE